MDVEVRLARAEDIPRLFEIRTAVQQNHLSLEQLSELGITPHSLAQIIAEQSSAWVAQVDGRVEAFSMVDLQEGEVFALFVDQAFEGRGLGGLLLAKAEFALFQHHTHISLITDGRDAVRANGFYLHHGWQAVERLEDGDCRYEKHAAAR